MVKVKFKDCLYEKIKGYINNKHMFVLNQHISNAGKSKVSGYYIINVVNKDTHKTVERIYVTGHTVGFGRNVLLEILLKQHNIETPLKEMVFGNSVEKPVFRTVNASPQNSPPIYFFEGMFFLKKANNNLAILVDKNKNIIGGEQCELQLQ